MERKILQFFFTRNHNRQCIKQDSMFLIHTFFRRTKENQGFYEWVGLFFIQPWSIALLTSLKQKCFAAIGLTSF